MSAAYVELSENAWNELDEIISGIEIKGSRYSDAMEAMTGK